MIAFVSKGQSQDLIILGWNFPYDLWEQKKEHQDFSLNFAK